MTAPSADWLPVHLLLSLSLFCCSFLPPSTGPTDSLSLSLLLLLEPHLRPLSTTHPRLRLSSPRIAPMLAVINKDFHVHPPHGLHACWAGWIRAAAQLSSAVAHVFSSAAAH
ncbi:hypothetical protein B0J11DRAFT_531532 [Dendryphion nanum]|uniref:Secreted protein n=1 Tax=Dendryphion nanum TaxID=256645 RepID=A0A9P9DP18_9PLEO|nr:hypothetical protein B0J11DRAFT_531532 [Dendryphion nanum]